jgi:hypothetical protein
MIDSCSGGTDTFCIIGQGITLANVCQHLPVDAAQAVNSFLLSLGAG